MRKIQVTKRAYNRLLEHAGGQLNAEQVSCLENGLYEFEVDEEVWERLNALDTDPSKALELLISGSWGTA